MGGLKWTDSKEIAGRLHEEMPDQDPLAVRFIDLHKWVCEIDDFDDEARASNEAKLQAIQTAWVEECQNATK